jgi:argininosuccinate lyase
LQTFAVEISDDVYAVLTLEGSLNSRNHIGGTAPAQVKSAIARARRTII